MLMLSESHTSGTVMQANPSAVAVLIMPNMF